ncbi:MAG: hypothetical protein ACYC5X_15535 [Syntrophales bacterium]
MDQFTKEDLQELLTPSGEWRVSLYMPTHRSPVEGRQDLVRFKNLLRETEERLIRGGLRGPEAAEFVAPLQKLLLAVSERRAGGIPVAGKGPPLPSSDAV